MIWKKPHINKIYEALSAIADDRIKQISPTEAQVYSTSGNKFYTVTIDTGSGAMMSDDNSAYWTDSLSYPMIAFLMLMGKVKYDKQYLPFLKDIEWKDINQKFNNDFDKSTEFVLETIDRSVVDLLKKEAANIYEFVCQLEIGQLGSKKVPSKAY